MYLDSAGAICQFVQLHDSPDMILPDTPPAESGQIDVTRLPAARDGDPPTPRSLAMLTILGGYDRSCAGVTRRRMLQVGGAGLFGLSLPRVLAAEAAPATSQSGAAKPRAKSVIFLFLFGGPSQLETFDPKPAAPESIRGPFAAIETRTRGLRVSEHLPRVAALSDRLCVIRSMTHGYNDHSTAGHYIQTGHPWHVPIGGGFNATDRDWPAMGSVVEYVDQQSGGRTDS